MVLHFIIHIKMAYAAVASLSETIHLIVNYHQHSISPIFKNQITSLHEHTFFLQSFLDDFPYETRSFEEKIREVTAVAEDTIELLLSDSLLESTVGTSKPNFDFGELQSVTKEIESIVEGVKGRRTESVDGFNEDLMKIISRLLGGSSELEIIPIVGMGGIGKTTLARNAYDNPVIVEHFEIRAWVTDSQDFNRRGIILDLLDSVDRLDAGDGSTSEDNLIVNLKLILSRKRYLIVIDDLWNLKSWDMLKFILPDNSNGSRIILTTRLLVIARCVNSSCRVHEMSLMDVDQSWNLLRQKIFKGNPCPAELVDIGKMIARSCRGLPLVIAVISGILTAHQTQDAWEDIAENEKTVINVDDHEHLFGMLLLSYIYLPHHLRPCFLYLGIFPEDREIHASKLIKLWVAEGFLDEIESKSFEETGEEYLEDLVSRSLVSVSKRKSDGRIKSVSIHDLLRCLCIRQARKDFFFLDGRRGWWEATELQRRGDVEEDYQLHNLIHLPKLETLKVEALKQYGLSPAFPPTLKKLSLSGVKLPWENMKIVGSLPNL